MSTHASETAPAAPSAFAGLGLTSGALVLRPGRADDAGPCGQICFEAFRAISGAHAFPEDFPDAAAARDLFAFALTLPDTHVVVAELDGRIVGSNMAWAQTPITGVGPITVAPAVQNVAVGRQLMAHIVERWRDSGRPGIRLVQAAYHNRSLALYTRLGFRAREPLSAFQGTPPGLALRGCTVRPATQDDLAACGALHQRLHGFSRNGDLAPAVARGTANIVERDGRITGYATEIGFFGHAVGERNRDLMALIAAAPAFPGPGFLVPTRNAVLMRWCLERGLRIVQPMTLMSQGFWRRPTGAFLPSVLF